jgi:hypothetical protein
MTTKPKPEWTLRTNPWVVYDNAVQSFLQQSVIGDKEELQPVPINFATPRKEFASQLTLNPKNVDPITRKTPVDNPRQQKTVPYPTMALTRLTPVFDIQRFRPLVERKLKILDRNRSWMQARYALPYDIQYQVDMRAKYRTHMNQMINNIILQFYEPYMPLLVNWGDPYGSKHVYLNMGTLQDNSILEVEDENKDRTLRATATLTLKAWFLQKLTQTPTALKLFTNVYAVPIYESLDEVEAEGEKTLTDTYVVNAEELAAQVDAAEVIKEAREEKEERRHWGRVKI